MSSRVGSGALMANSELVALATAHLEAQPRTSRYAVAVVLEAKTCVRFQSIPLPSDQAVREFWRDVLTQSAPTLLQSTIGKKS